MTHSHAPRRHFLKAMAGLAGSAAVPRLGLPLAAQLAGLGALASHTAAGAADTSGYKALVCVYLQGGSDSHNWVVPMDTTGYADYARVRAELAWPLARLQPITSTGQAAGRSFGMPTELAGLRNWYESGQAAVVANVGPLVRPVSKAEFQAGAGLPSKLFSHNDQASTWQSLLPEGAPTGWGGRMGDILMSANAYPVFTAVSATGNAVYLAGNVVNQYQVTTTGPVAATAMTDSAAFGSASVAGALQRAYANSSSGDRVRDEYARVMQRGLGAGSTLASALGSTNVPALPALAVAGATGAMPATLDKVGLAQQLRVVAQMMAAHQSLGMRRQVFMVAMGGFDTHNNQMRDQPGQMAQVSMALDYFLGTLANQGLLNNVTLFTASDFGRTLVCNGDGSDHGWGSHHFVAGGAVRGRNIHGSFPTTALGTAEDLGSGRLLPSTSVSELAASLAGWMGLTPAEQAFVLPNLGNFTRRLALF